MTKYRHDNNKQLYSTGRQRDIKWSGPKPYNEKEKIVVPVVRDPYDYNWNYNCNYYYEEPKEEEKPDKSKYINHSNDSSPRSACRRALTFGSSTCSVLVFVMS